MQILIVLLPLFGSLFSGFGGRFLGSKGSGILSTVCMCITLLLVFITFFKVGIQGETISITSYSWVNSELFNVSFGFLFDSLTVVMLVVVCTISTLVHLYSMEYMSHDPHLPRFMSYLSLFTFFMLILVTANNLLQMFVGWEGVGRSEEHTSELQSLMRISYAVFCLKKKIKKRKILNMMISKCI